MPKQPKSDDLEDNGTLITACAKAICALVLLAVLTAITEQRQIIYLFFGRRRERTPYEFTAEHRSE